MQEQDAIFLGLFPLELVVFPGELQHLHIFEPRYKQLIRECDELKHAFGLPACTEGKLSGFGTEMAINRIFRVYPEGEMDIEVEGKRRFRLVKYIRNVPDKLYSGGEVVFLEDEADAQPETAEELAKSYARLHELLETGVTRDDFSAPGISYRIAPEVGLDLPEKIKLLSLDRESARQDLLLEHVRKIIPVLERAREVKRRVKGNGHFQKMPRLDL